MIDRSNPGAVVAGNATQEFTWNYEPAFSVAAGWIGESGFGLRAGYFHFDQNSNLLQPALTAGAAGTGQTISVPNVGLPGAGAGVATFSSPGVLLQLAPPLGQDLLSFNSSLLLYSVDVEAVGQLASGPWWFLASAGARYLRIEQEYAATLTNPGGLGASEQEVLLTARNFTGAGPTFSLDALRKVGGTGLGLFCNVRGSYLLGSMREQSLFVQNISDPNNVTLAGSQSTRTSASTSRVQGLPVAEVEVGGDLRANLARASLFLRLSAVSQTYFEAGDPTSSHGNLTLFGGKITAGLNY
jgi:hypothetical protein